MIADIHFAKSITESHSDNKISKKASHPVNALTPSSLVDLRTQ